MYRVYMTNFHYYLDKECSSLEEAKELGKSTGFQFTVYQVDPVTKEETVVGFAEGVTLQWVGK